MHTSDGNQTLMDFLFAIIAGVAITAFFVMYVFVHMIAPSVE